MKKFAKIVTAGLLAGALVGCLGLAGCGGSSDKGGQAASAGGSFDNVVKTTCFLKDVAKDFAAFNAVYAEAMGDNKPARSCVGVADLPKGVLVEVEVIAVID